MPDELDTTPTPEDLARDLPAILARLDSWRTPLNVADASAALRRAIHAEAGLATADDPKKLWERATLAEREACALALERLAAAGDECDLHPEDGGPDALRCGAIILRAAERYREPGPAPPPLLIRYCNHKGQVAIRPIVPRRWYYGECAWHKGRQPLLDALDVGKGAERTFALRGVLAWLDETGCEMAPPVSLY